MPSSREKQHLLLFGDTVGSPDRVHYRLGFARSRAAYFPYACAIWPTSLAHPMSMAA